MQVCQAIGRPPDYLITYLGQELSANSKIDKDTEKAYVTGAMDERHVQQLVFKFIKDTVQVRLRPAFSFSRKRRSQPIPWKESTESRCIPVAVS
jgi:hypothetical protein